MTEERIAYVLSGRHPAELGNAVSDAIHAAMQRGMETDEAVCVVAAVAADYACREYGDAYLAQLAEVVQSRTGQPYRRESK